jgi:hypothetical protein
VTCCSATTSSSTTSSSRSNDQHSSSNTQPLASVQSQPQPAAASTSGRHETSQGASTEQLVSFEEVQEIAAARGLHISLKTLGPFYRITCRDGETRCGCHCCAWEHDACLHM